MQKRKSAIVSSSSDSVDSRGVSSDLQTKATQNPEVNVLIAKEMKAKPILVKMDRMS